MRSLIERNENVRPVFRVLMTIAIIVDGLMFVLLGTFMLLLQPPSRYPHPAGAALPGIAMAATGAGFVWIGSRVLAMKSAADSLLSPVARGRCG